MTEQLRAAGVTIESEPTSSTSTKPASSVRRGRRRRCLSSATPRATWSDSPDAERSPTDANLRRVSGRGSFRCHHLRMPRSRRSPNRINDDSLVDDAGYEWYRIDKDLRR